MQDPERLSGVFVELANTLVREFDVVDFMTVLARRCVELLDADEAGVVLADEHEVLRFVASSDESARLLELFELQNQEGPCLDCYRTGHQLMNQRVGDPDERWPRFGPEARRLGFALVHALPMRLRKRAIGAINVFSAEGRPPLGQLEINVGQAVADVATIGLLQEHRAREARLLAEQLQSALNSRVLIEQAKGMLAEREHVETSEAFELLRAYARRHGARLSDVAKALLEGSLTSGALAS